MLPVFVQAPNFCTLASGCCTLAGASVLARFRADSCSVQAEEPCRFKQFTGLAVLSVTPRRTSQPPALSASVTLVALPTIHTSGTCSVRSGASVTKLRRTARHTSSYVGRSLQGGDPM
jgi:hypothetical protein